MCIIPKHSPVFSLMPYFVLDTTNRWLAWLLYGYPLQYSCLENSTDRETWVGYSSWGHKESDTTEWVALSFHLLQSSFVLRGHVEKKIHFQKEKWMRLENCLITVPLILVKRYWYLVSRGIKDTKYLILPYIVP